MRNVIGPEVGYVDLLNYATTQKLLKDQAEGKDFQKSPLRPSAAGDCTRALYYGLMQYSGLAKYTTEVNDPEVHRLLNLGHSVEYHVLKQFEHISDLFDIKYKQQSLSFARLEAKNNPKLSQWLEGSLDLVFWSEKYKCVADVKSKKDKYSAFYKSSWDETTEKLNRMRSVKAISELAFWVEDLEAFLNELNDPFFAANFLQLNLYANAQFLIERGVDHGAILQYNKNDSRIREVRFKPCRKLYDHTVAKFRTVLEAVDENKPELATRDYVLGSIKCSFCKYRDECWGGVDAKQAFFDTLPDKRWPVDTKRLGRNGEALEKLFERHQALSTAESERETTERAIALLLANIGVGKVRLENGEVYEAKQLKERVKIQRSKA